MLCVSVAAVVVVICEVLPDGITAIGVADTYRTHLLPGSPGPVNQSVERLILSVALLRLRLRLRRCCRRLRLRSCRCAGSVHGSLTDVFPYVSYSLSHSERLLSLQPSSTNLVQLLVLVDWCEILAVLLTARARAIFSVKHRMLNNTRLENIYAYRH